MALSLDEADRWRDPWDMDNRAQEILHFWFHEIDSRLWFTKDRGLDELVRTRFFEIYKKVACCETYTWRKTARGRLAEIIVLDQAVRLFSQQGLESSLEFELLHKEMIDRFGRYPYRNEILGRDSTREELEFLKLPGSTF